MKKVFVRGGIVLLLVAISFIFWSNHLNLKTIQAPPFGDTSKGTDFIKSFKEADFDIAGFNIYNNPKISNAEVLKTFGEPKRRKQTLSPRKDSAYDLYDDLWTYQNIQVAFLTAVTKGASAPHQLDMVVAFMVTGAQFETNRGIKIGDSKQKVIAKYGAGELDGKSLIYSVNMYFMQFDFKRDKVSKILFVGEPD